MAPRTPLLRPDRYFEQRSIDPVRGLVLAVVLTAAVLASIWGLGAIFADRIDGTVAVDNPNRPPDAFCENGGDATVEQVNGSGFDCDAPATVERDVDGVVSGAVGQFYAPMLVGFPMVLLFAGALLHAGTALFGGEGALRKSLTVTAWGMAPMLVLMPTSLVLLWATMDPVAVTPGSDPAALRQPLLGAIRQWRPLALALNAVGSLWGAVVWTFGLASARSVERSAAAVVAGTVTLLFLFVGLT